tara:strand:+ start:52570 stop:53418 length:849 start_codon:yes stop_codon:yes gene_type:complete
MRIFLVLFLSFISSLSSAQELYINAEPASLIPKGTKVVRLNHHTIFLNGTNIMGGIGNAIIMSPSISYGLSKKIMVSGSFQFSNKPYEQDMMPNFGFSGFKLSSKQRILTTDKQKYHTRLSSFIKYSYHDNKFMKNNLDIEIQDTGFEFGIIGTQLINKLAISVTSAVTRISNIDEKYTSGSTVKWQSINLNTIQNSISAGYLLFPRKYKSYKQTNFNLYLEYLTNTILTKGFPDRYDKFTSTLAPGIQFIIMSRSRLDFSYKIRSGAMPEEFVVKLTYIIY